jgi:molybdopterin-containing oxidoreductase family molybdopterin binding subunit
LHYLEALNPIPGFVALTGSKPAVFYGQNPVVKPPFEAPWDAIVSDGEILRELARRAGFAEDVYAAWNATWKLSPAYALEEGKEYSYRDMVDRYLKHTYGPDKGVDWYVQHGIIVKERGLKERYPGAYPKPRTHVYHEYMLDAGRQVEAMTRKLGIPWDTSDYIPLPEWRPGPGYVPKSPEFDLYMITAKTPYQSLTTTGGNPLLNEVSGRQGADRILMHVDAAKRKGLPDGAWVEVETDMGKKARGRLRLTTGIHPEVTLVWSAAGRWAKAATQGGEPRGIHFNSLLTMDDEHMDFVSGAVDCCLRVKITRAETR